MRPNGIFERTTSTKLCGPLVIGNGPFDAVQMEKL